MRAMDPSAWSPYSQQPFAHGNTGSPRNLPLPPPAPNEDALNNYGNPNMLLSPCQGLQSLPPRPGTADPSAPQPPLLNSHFEPNLLSPSIRNPKGAADFFGETLYNGVCKENQSAIPDFIQTSGLPSRNENMGCMPPEGTNNGFHPVPPVAFQPKNADRPSPGPFGVLPHEAVMPRQNRYDRSKDKFVAPISKPVSTPFNSGPFSDQDVNSVYTSTPLSTHSVFSNENASHSPAVNSVTSPNMSNFSSPSDYYSSPKNNFGAYNNVQSPVPQSPSVAQHSYPSSPFTNIDPNSHISTAPPCSPMSGGSYVNKLQDRSVVSQVPQRNGQKSQHSPGSNVMCYNAQPPQGPFHHGHQSAVSKTPDYHSDYGVYSHNHISPTSYPSVYPAIHPPQMQCDDSAMTPRQHPVHPSMPPHDNRLQYSHSTSMPAASTENPVYLQSKTTGTHDMMYGSCPTNIPPSQSMHPTSYENCSPVIDPLSNQHPVRHHHHHHHNPSMMPPMMSGERQYGYPPPDITDDKNALDMFNSHIDSGVHNPDNCQSSISSLLEAELPIVETGMLTGRHMRHPEPNRLHQHNVLNTENMNQDMAARAQMMNFHDSNSELAMKNYSYPRGGRGRGRRARGTSLPRKKGKRGRRRKSEYFGSMTYARLKNDQTSYYNSEFEPNTGKFPEYNSENRFTNNECRNSEKLCHNSIKDNADAYEFHAVCYPPSKYQSVRKKDSNSNHMQNCLKPYLTIEQELSFLADLKFPHDEENRDSAHSFMRTRNKDSEGFLQCYKNFLELRRSQPEDEVEVATTSKVHKHSKEHKEKSKPDQPKLIISLGRGLGGWHLTKPLVSPKISDTGNTSDSKDSSIVSSHKVSDDENSSSAEEEHVERVKDHSDSVHRKHSKHSAKRIFKHSSRRKSNDNAWHSYTNSETLPVEKTSKRRGRKAKNSETTAIQNKHSTLNTTCDVLEKFPVPIKVEVFSDGEKQPVVACTRRSLRSKKEDPAVKEITNPGPSVKAEPVYDSSDEIDVIDDSEGGDPAWTPSSRVPRSVAKSSDNKSGSGTSVVRRARRKRGSRSYSARRRKSDSATPRNGGRGGGRRGRGATTATVPDINIKKEKEDDEFLVSNSDIGKERLPLWRIDRGMKLLQRFEPHENQGMAVHRNTFCYTAWNDATRGQYTQAKVKFLSLSRVLYMVEYMGPEKTPDQAPDPPELPSAHPLRKSFEVFLQSLISQALEPNSCPENKKMKDEKLAKCIKDIEDFTSEKKSLLMKGTWDSELQKCAELYPRVNILPQTASDDSKCQICSVSKGEKLVQFYGPPYDRTTLGSTGTPPSNKTQFNVCTTCSTTISLYSRLHHQKYNMFSECCTKMNRVRGNRDLTTSVLIENCLKDSTWVNTLFSEAVEAWSECGKVS